MSFRVGRRLTVVVGVVCAAYTLSPASAADLITKEPEAANNCVQAVDGLNGKISGWGGSFANDPLYGGTGTLAAPLGCSFGVQIAATGASFDNHFLGAVEGHWFWRDPSIGLLGLYASSMYWDQVGGVRVNHISPEAEWYSGQWTVRGVAGVEFGNNASGTVGGLLQTYDIKTRFFDEVDVAFYAQDNLEIYAGHRYLGGKNAAALGGEYGIPMGHGVMGALFAEGLVGEDNFHGVAGGIRFYFGQKDKTLIRRHREDDPVDWSAGVNGTGSVSNGGTTTTPTTTCSTGITGCCSIAGTCTH